MAFTLAPIAGAIGAFAAHALWCIVVLRPPDAGIGDVMLLSVLIGCYALIIAAVFLAVVGALCVAWVRMTGKVPTRSTAIAVGLLTGFLPIAACAVSGLRTSSGWNFEGMGDELTMPVAFLAASVASSWSFWFLGLKGRTQRSAQIEGPPAPPP